MGAIVFGKGRWIGRETVRSLQKLSKIRQSNYILNFCRLSEVLLSHGVYVVNITKQKFRFQVEMLYLCC